MLTLTRRKGETIKIGQDVTVVVTQIEGNRVQISIDAPRNLRVLRGELASVREDKDERVTHS